MWQFADAVRRNREVILMFLLWDSKHFHVFECIMGEGMSVRPYVNIQDHSADFFYGIWYYEFTLKLSREFNVVDNYNF